MEEKEMTFWAHLEDLRWSLVRVVAVLFVFVVVCFCLRSEEHTSELQSLRLISYAVSLDRKSTRLNSSHSV